MSLVSRALAGGFLTTLPPGEPWFSGLTTINSGELGLEFGYGHVCIFKSSQVTAMEAALSPYFEKSKLLVTSDSWNHLAFQNKQ